MRGIDSSPIMPRASLVRHHLLTPLSGTEKATLKRKSVDLEPFSLAIHAQSDWFNISAAAMRTPSIFQQARLIKT
jgi:hypothetical protein